MRKVVRAKTSSVGAFAASAAETSRDARFLTHLSIGTRRVIRAAGELAALSNCYKTKHCYCEGWSSRMVCADIKSRLQGTILSPQFELGAAEEEKDMRGEGDKAVFKRVLTPRQGPNGSQWRGVGHRELRLRVSPVILVYMPPSCLDAGARGSWILPLLHLPRSRHARQASSSEAGATDVSARCAQGPHQAPPRNEFQQVKTRGQAVRAHAMQVPSRGLPSPCLFPSHLSRQLRASLFQRDLLSSATRGFWRIALCRMNGPRAGLFRCRPSSRRLLADISCAFSENPFGARLEYNWLVDKLITNADESTSFDRLKLNYAANNNTILL